MKSRAILAGLLASWLWCAPALAASSTSSPVYPDKPIKLIVPFPPGGLADAVARPLAQRLGAALGQPVIVENRGGASGTIGTGHVAASAPDGYTLLFATANEIAVCPLLYAKLPYDTFNSFTPIASVVDFPAVLVTAPGGARDLAALMSQARQRPGKVAFASSGAGSTNHLVAEVLRKAEGIDIVNVHYKGGGPAMTDVAGGHVDAMFATLPSALPLIQGGTLRALATSGPQRAKVLPDVPTLVELGVRGGDVTIWAGVLGPAGMPPAVVQRLSEEIGRITNSAEFTAFLESTGAQAHFVPPDGLRQSIRTHYDFWSRTIKEAGISLQ